MILRSHIHYDISATTDANGLPLVTRQAFDFDPVIQIESPLTVDGPWFSVDQTTAKPTLKYAGGNSAVPDFMKGPRVLVGDQLHIEDTASCISVGLAPGQVLHDIDPGTVNRAEVDLTLLAQRNADGSVTHQLCFLFINPSPHQPVPFNIDAGLTKDKHDYVKRLLETPERAYHKLLLRHCLVPGYQVWPDVMTLEMAAAYCHVAKPTMATWVKDGWIKASPGTKPRILKKNLDDYLESR